VKLDILLYYLFEVAHHGLNFLSQLELEVGFQVGKVDEIVLRLSVRSLKAYFQLVFDHRASFLKLGLLGILLA